jgi:hypothetical protein
MIPWQIEKMIEEIKDIFKDRVKKHEWIDDKTTQYVFQKVRRSHSSLWCFNMHVLGRDALLTN